MTGSSLSKISAPFTGEVFYSLFGCLQQRLYDTPDLLVDIFNASQPALFIQTADTLPAQNVGGLTGALPAGGQIGGVLLMDIGGGVGGALPGAQHLNGGLSGHVQVDHHVGPGQTQLAMLKIVQPAQEIAPLPGPALHPLVHGVGGRIADGQEQTAIVIVLPPHLL